MAHTIDWITSRGRVEYDDVAHAVRPLCDRLEWPSDKRAANTPNEVAPPHFRSPGLLDTLGQNPLILRTCRRLTIPDRIADARTITQHSLAHSSLFFVCAFEA